MGLTFNGKTPSAIQIGGKQVDNIVMNGEVVWPAQPSEPDYFYVDLGSSSTKYIVLKKVGSPTTGSDIQYGIWNPQIPPSGGIGWRNVVFDSNNECIIDGGGVSSGGKIYFRSTTGWSTNLYNYYYFSEASRSFNIGGDMRTLIDYSDLSLDSVPASCFLNLFDSNTKLVNASGIDLSHINTLNNNCYYGMFRGCAALTVAPSLPATTLANYCYYGMFQHCTSLTTAPTLPATILTVSCYNSMFLGCSSLNKVITYAQDISATSCRYQWLSGVAASGDFYNLGGATYPSGANGIPQGWTVHTSL